MGQLADWLAGVPVSPASDGLYLADWVLPVDQPPIPQGFVWVMQGRICHVGRQGDLGQKDHLGQKDQNGQLSLLPIRAQANLITPGLINTHTHLELTYDHVVPAPHGMGHWLEDVVTLTRQDTDAAQVHRIQSGIRQLLASGTLYCHDISRQGACLPWLLQAGMGAQVAIEFFHPSDTAFNPDALQRVWQKLTPGKNQLLGLSPHSLYNVHPAAWGAAVAAVKPAFIHTHLSESPDELAWLRGKTHHGIATLHQQVLGRVWHNPYPSDSVSVYLKNSGLAALGGELPVRFAHGTFCTQEDANALTNWAWQVLHCPRSNQHLTGQTTASGYWPLLPLGTDSTLSCPDLDSRNEARHAATLHHWTADQALRSVTWDAAQALGVNHNLGSLTPGKQAHMALWRCLADSPNPAEGWLNHSALHQVVLA